MKRPFAVLICALICASALSSCMTLTTEETQDVRFETPGVAGAKCTIRRPGYIQYAFPPQTLRISKMREPLEVACEAPGNRHKTIIVEPKIPVRYLTNLTNLYLATPVDYASGAMFQYPERIAIDFSDVEPSMQDYPEYEIRDHYARDLVGVEEWRPGQAALLSDRGRTAPQLQPHVIGAESDAFGDENGSSMMLAPGDGFAEDLLSSPLSTAGSFGSAQPPARRSSPAPASSSSAPAPSGGSDAVIPPPPPSFIK